MPGTLGSGTGTMPDVQSGNAQNTRGTRRDAGGTHANNGQGGQHNVHADPAAGAGFTWERATKNQCVKGQTYPVAPGSEEARWFIENGSTALQAAAALTPPAPMSPLLVAVASALAMAQDPADVLTIRHIEHAQLKFVPNPSISAREPPGNDPSYVPTEWENYQVEGADGKTLYMAQAPVCEGGKHYEVFNQRSWDFAVRIVGELELGVTFCKDKDGSDAAIGDIDYAFLLRLGRRGPKHLYASGMSQNEVICSVAVGEINASTGGFVAWSSGGPNTDLVCIKDAALQNRLFSQLNTRGDHWPVWRDLDAMDEEDDVMADLRASLNGNRGARQRFNLEARDQRMCFSHIEKGSKEPEWIAVCNFELLRLDGLYQFVEDDAGDPYFKIVCRSMIDVNGQGDVYLAADDTLRTPRLRNKRSLLVEVLVQPGALKSNADVSKLFQKYHVRLLPSIMTPDMLRCWMAEQEPPPVTRCIVRFGALTPDSSQAQRPQPHTHTKHHQADQDSAARLPFLACPTHRSRQQHQYQHQLACS